MLLDNDEARAREAFINSGGRNCHVWHKTGEWLVFSEDDVLEIVAVHAVKTPSKLSRLRS